MLKGLKYEESKKNLNKYSDPMLDCFFLGLSKNLINHLIQTRI